MKKIRFLSVLIAALLLFSLASCEIKDGMLWFDLEDENSVLGVHTEKKDEEKAPEESDPSKVDCEHLNLNTVIEVEPTCTENGIAHDECPDCKKVFESRVIDAKGHTEGMWIVEVKPTIDSEGLRYNDCTVCGARQYETLGIIKYSEGLYFASFGDGTCCVLSRGECTDTKISVPETSPEGETVIAVAADAFLGDDSLVEIILPDTVEIIGSGAFKSSGITRVILPENLKDIGNEAFYDCRELLQLSIPKSVERIGPVPVSPSYISNVTVDSENEFYRVESNCLVGHDGTLLLGYGKCSIPAGVTMIAAYAFAGNEALTSISLPASVIEIGEGAFSDTGIREINIPGSVSHIGDKAFLGCDSLEKIILNIGTNYIGPKVLDECGSLSTIEFYGSVDQWNGIYINSDNVGLYSVSIDFIEGVAPEDVYYYGATTISGNALELYNILVENVMRETPVSRIKLSSSDKYTIDDFYLARLIFLSDYPENFWWGGAASYSRNSSDYLLSLELEYAYSGAELEIMRDALDEACDEILAGLPSGSVFDKALYLHDAVAERVTYKFTDNDQTPYGALVEREAVCNGYATAYQLLLQRAGIRAWTVNGTSRGENHAWNVVWLSESVCVYTDVTWDDQDTVMHYYFNMSLDEISIDHNTNSDFDLPACGHDGYSYDDLSPDLKVLNDHDSAYVLAGFFGEEQQGVRKAQFYYYGDDFGAWLSQNGSSLVKYLNCENISYSHFESEYVVVASGVK